jgi:hypothetical protein
LTRRKTLPHGSGDFARKEGEWFTGSGGFGSDDGLDHSDDARVVALHHEAVHILRVNHLQQTDQDQQRRD